MQTLTKCRVPLERQRHPDRPARVRTILYELTQQTPEVVSKPVASRDGVKTRDKINTLLNRSHKRRGDASERSPIQLSLISLTVRERIVTACPPNAPTLEKLENEDVPPRIDGTPACGGQHNNGDYTKKQTHNFGLRLFPTILAQSSSGSPSM